MLSNDWPPLYRLKVGGRVRGLKLKVSEQHGIEVLSEKPISEAKVLRFLKDHRDWLLQHRQVWEVFSKPKLWPEQLVFHSVLQRWQIETWIDPSVRPFMRADKARHVLSLTVIDKDHALLARLLSPWLRRYASQHLLCRLNYWSKLTGLKYNDVSIRMQKNRWGSCSEEKNISLNAKLIFYPQPVVDYVLLHELCHTVHMNHSKSFWALVKRWMPDYDVQIKCLRDNSYLPDCLT